MTEGGAILSLSENQDSIRTPIVQHMLHNVIYAVANASLSIAFHQPEHGCSEPGN
jgi:hypothetical protein